MKYLVISDIHANFTALEAVLSAAGEVDGVLCLGDLVGYGPDPNQCTERIRSLPNLTCIKGNHDAAVCAVMDVDQFNGDAGEAILITRKKMTRENLEFLAQLPDTILLGEFTLAHGSPRSPEWEYILDAYTALGNFEFISTLHALVGHSHMTLNFELDMKAGEISRRFIKKDEKISITNRMILNPGSVGQPRDNNPLSSFAILDMEALTWEIHRVGYDIVSVQKRIIKMGLPEKFADRLIEGW